MKKSFKRFAVLLVIALLTPLILPCIPTMKGLTGAEAYAATKNASLNLKNATVGVYSSPEYLQIYNRKSGAKYTITPNNKKIATVKNYGDYAEITGVSKGKTTITVTEKYKNKKKTIGKVSVSVVGPKFDYKEITLGVGGYGRSLPIIYYNHKAKYTITSSDTSIVKIDKSGCAVGVKWGTADVSVTESYKGKTTKLGSMKFTVAPAKISEEANSTINLNDYITLEEFTYYVNYYNDEAIYTAVSSDPTIVECATRTNSDGEEFDVLNGLKVGSTTITLYEEYAGAKNEVGTVNVTVKEIPVESFELSYIGDATQEYYLDDEYSGSRDLSYLFDVEPYDTTTPITYVSSNDSIVTVDNEGNVTPVSEGTAKITVSCGSFTQDITVIVSNSEYSDDEEYDDEYYE
jgi:hypothetical protein